VASRMVRGVYADRVGWFDGNATNLFPLSEKDRAAKLVGLMGAGSGIGARARKLLPVIRHVPVGGIFHQVTACARRRVSGRFSSGIVVNRPPLDVGRALV
jgi:hypothetical protein